VYDATIAFAGLTDSDTVATPPATDDDDPPPPPKIKVGDLVQVEIDGVLALPQPKRVRAIQEYEGQDWIFVEGSETGFPMNQTILQEAAAAPLAMTPPRLPLTPSTDELQKLTGETEWMRNQVGRETKVRLLVSGAMGAKEIGKLIKLLEAQRAVLSDDEEDDQ